MGVARPDPSTLPRAEFQDLAAQLKPDGFDYRMTDSVVMNQRRALPPRDRRRRDRDESATKMSALARPIDSTKPTDESDRAVMMRARPGSEETLRYYPPTWAWSCSACGNYNLEDHTSPATFNPIRRCSSCNQQPPMIDPPPYGQIPLEAMEADSDDGVPESAVVSPRPTPSSKPTTREMLDNVDVSRSVCRIRSSDMEQWKHDELERERDRRRRAKDREEKERLIRRTEEKEKEYLQLNKEREKLEEKHWVKKAEEKRNHRSSTHQDIHVPASEIWEVSATWPTVESATDENQLWDSDAAAFTRSPSSARPAEEQSDAPIDFNTMRNGFLKHSVRHKLSKKICYTISEDCTEDRKLTQKKLCALSSDRFHKITRRDAALVALRQPTNPDTANKSSASSTHIDSTLEQSSTQGIQSGNILNSTNSGPTLGASGAISNAPASSGGGNNMIGGMNYGDTNYDFFDPQHWMLDGLLDFNYSSVQPSQVMDDNNGTSMTSVSSNRISRARGTSKVGDSLPRVEPDDNVYDKDIRTAAVAEARRRKRMFNRGTFDQLAPELSDSEDEKSWTPMGDDGDMFGGSVARRMRRRLGDRRSLLFQDPPPEIEEGKEPDTVTEDDGHSHAAAYGPAAPRRPAAAVFNRKDLYTQHIRRMHQPPFKSKVVAARQEMPPLSAAMQRQFDKFVYEDHRRDSEVNKGTVSRDQRLHYLLNSTGGGKKLKQRLRGDASMIHGLRPRGGLQEVDNGQDAAPIDPTINGMPVVYA